MQNNERALFTVRELASLLGISEPSIYKYLRSGELPAIRCGRKWMIPREGISIWLRTIAGKLPVPAPVAVS